MKLEKMKKQVTTVLAIVLLCSLLSIRAWGAEGTLTEQAQWSGTVGQSWQDPFTISTAAQLAELAALVNSGAVYGEGASFAAAYYVQAADIDLASYATVNDGTGWMPIGQDKAHLFQGGYDGGGFAVRNLTINRAQEFQGLFGVAKNAVLRNITVSATITASQCAGAIVGRLEGATATLLNCRASGSVVTQGSFAGGIVGVSDSVITGCTSSAAVTAASDAGGVVGCAYFKVIGCRASGVVTAGSSAGGIVGRMLYGRIRECAFTGSVTATRVSGSAGGIVGYLECAALTGSYALGNVTASGAGGSAGGIVGSMATDSTIAGCYATGSVTASGGAGYAGGIAGAMLGRAQQNSAVTPLMKGMNLIGCYATGGVSAGTGMAGGLVGMTEGGVTLKSSAALGNDLSGAKAARICAASTASATGNLVVRGCYAWEKMNVNGAPVVGGQANDTNGGALLYANGAFAPSLRDVLAETIGAAWSFDGALPTLEAAGGQQPAALPPWLA